MVQLRIRHAWFAICLESAFSVVAAMTAMITAPVNANERQGNSPSASTADGHVMAIDVVLEPDALMVSKAEAANALLRENYPHGYTLGKAHVPHITLMQAYVREDDLNGITTSVARLADATRPEEWELTATGYTHAIWSGVAITTIAIERSQQLDRFQENVAKAVADRASPSGTAAAFSATSELPRIDKEIIDYVKNFAAKSSGKKYHPHVTIGVAHEEFVKKLEAEKFEKFKFHAKDVAIYQLGNFGTAQKKLWEWKADDAVLSTR